MKRAALLFVVPILAGRLLAAPAEAPGKKDAKSGKTDEIVFPAPPDKPRIRFLRSIKTARDLKGGKAGAGTKLFEFLAGGDSSGNLMVRPYGVWVQGENLLVADTNDSKVLRMNLATGKVDSFRGGGEAAMASPVGVTSDPEGNVYVADSGGHAVLAFSPDRKLMWKADILGGEAGKLDRPAGLSWTPKGELLVVDAGNHRVVYLAKDGKFLREACRNKKDDLALPNPGNVWVEPDGKFIVSDSISGRVHLFDADGKGVSGFGEMGDGPGYMARPRGVATDSDGNIYVADAIFCRVQIFNRKGQLLLYFGGPGEKPGQMSLPAGIFIDSSDKVYVVDSKNIRIQIFQYIKYPEDPTSSEGDDKNSNKNK